MWCVAATPQNRNPSYFRISSNLVLLNNPTPASPSGVMSQASSPKDKYWSIPQAELLEDLESSDRGLSPDEAAARLARYGPNLLKAKEQSTAFGIFIRQFKNPIIIILLVATIVSGIVQDWLDAGIILLIVIASALLSTFQEHRASQAAEKLRAQVTIKSVVLRSDQTQSIPSSDIVPGDVILLSAGSSHPCGWRPAPGGRFFCQSGSINRRDISG